MGLFSKIDLSDLGQVREAVADYARQLAFYARGVGNTELLEESQRSAVEEMRSARLHLLSAGREKDLKALEKRLLNSGTFISNGAYNMYYSPLIWECLDTKSL